MVVVGDRPYRLIEMLREGRITAPFASEETGYSLQYVRDRLRRGEWSNTGTCEGV